MQLPTEAEAEAPGIVCVTGPGGGLTTCEVGKALTPPLCCALVVTATKPQAFNQQKDQVWDSAAGSVNAARVESRPHLIGPLLGCRWP